MQASKEWLPPVGTLGEILAETRERVASIDSRRPRTDAGRAGPRDLRRARLSDALRGETVAVIAEVKRRSPSRGSLNPTLGAGEQAARFARGGAAAVSVLTEPNRFGGSINDLRSAAASTRLPLIRKDFHIAADQLIEAADNQASAVLLIARALPPRELESMMTAARDAGLEAVVEVRTDDELLRALAAGATIVGVNARDLETLQVDESVPERLIPKIPASVVAIWESGVSSRADVERAAAAGADAVLVGSALSLSDDPEALLAALTNVPRRPRG